jgi:hypothetical protein
MQRTVLRAAADAERLALMIYRSAHLIANNVALEGTLSFDIGVVLRRPDERELARIRQLLAPVASLSFRTSVNSRQRGLA